MREKFKSCGYCWFYNPCPCGACLFGVCECTASTHLHEYVSEDNAACPEFYEAVEQ